MIDSKDVVLAILGASAALAGFVLVFLGIVTASYQSYSGDVPQQVIGPYRTAGAGLLGTFWLSLVTVAVCLAWLALGGPGSLYGWTVGLFALQLIAVFGTAGWAAVRVFWR